jgi:hypothetical protein
VELLLGMLLDCGIFLVGDGVRLGDISGDLLFCYLIAGVGLTYTVKPISSILDSPLLGLHLLILLLMKENMIMLLRLILPRPGCFRGMF